MFVYRVLFSLSLIPTVTIAMSQGTQLRPWVLCAHFVYINPSYRKDSFYVPISHYATIQDIKKHLQSCEKIPVDQQTLHPLFTKEEEEHLGPLLEDTDNIRCIMSTYNSNRLYLKIQPNDLK